MGCRHFHIFNLFQPWISKCSMGSARRRLPKIQRFVCCSMAGTFPRTGPMKCGCCATFDVQCRSSKGSSAVAAKPESRSAESNFRANSSWWAWVLSRTALLTAWKQDQSLPLRVFLGGKVLLLSKFGYIVLHTQSRGPKLAGCSHDDVSLKNCFENLLPCFPQALTQQFMSPPPLTFAEHANVKPPPLHRLTHQTWADIQTF